MCDFRCVTSGVVIQWTGLYAFFLLIINSDFAKYIYILMSYYWLILFQDLAFTYKSWNTVTYYHKRLNPIALWHTATFGSMPNVLFRGLLDSYNLYFCSELQVPIIVELVPVRCTVEISWRPTTGHVSTRASKSLDVTPK